MIEKIIDFIIDFFWTRDRIIEGIIKNNITDSKTLALNKKDITEANKGKKRKIIRIKFFLFSIRRLYITMC